MRRKGVSFQEKKCYQEASDVIPFVRKLPRISLSVSGCHKCSSNCYNVIQIRSLAIKDRAVLDKGVEALVSFVCAYKLQHCSYVFRFIMMLNSFVICKYFLSPSLSLRVSRSYKVSVSFLLTYRWKSLKIGKLAMGYGLLRFPSVSEVKQGRLSSEGFTPVEGVNFEDIKFK